MKKFKIILLGVVAVSLITVIGYYTIRPPLVSVVMPVYNRADTIRKAIDSILNQTFTDFEFIIVDDGSTDGTTEILDYYAKKDSRVRVLKNEQNRGISYSRNKGNDSAKGKYIANYSRIFVFDDWGSKQNFFKQFFSGIFITIVMTGLDQDMMQKNLTCKSLKDAQKNMYCYGLSFVPVNFLFLSLGVLLLLLASQQGLALPSAGDDILPFFAAEGRLGFAVLVFFTIGIIAAAFSSADSALAALTTSFCIDIVGIENRTEKEAESIRKKAHLGISVVFIGIILLFKAANNDSIIDAIYTIASYTYGPLLGLFIFGLFTKMRPRDRFVPYIAIASPFICFAIDRGVYAATGYQFGYEMLMFNGFLTFVGLTILSINNKNTIYGN